jgi:site-specific DNA recombinase
VAGKPLSSRKVGIYCRISDDRDGRGEGVDRQEAACRKLAKERKWSVVDVYVDNDISATQTKKERPEHKRLIHDLEEGRINTVVVWAVDRLYRRPVELETFLDLMTSHPDIMVTACQGSEMRLETSDGRAMARVMVALARRETDLLAARITAKHKELAVAGKPHGGMRAFGYKVGQIEIDSKEANVVREMYSRFLKDSSLSELVRWLNSKKIPTARGTTHWSRKTVSDILRNPRYAGFRSHHGVLTKAVWPAIIDEETWTKARDILADPTRRTGKYVKNKYLLTGMVFCGSCGHRMTNMTRGRDLGSTNSYACRNDPALVMRGCGGVRMVGAWVDEFVTEAALHRLKTDKQLVKSLSKSDNKQSAKELHGLRNDLHATLKKKDEAQQLWTSNVLSTEEFERAFRALGEEQTKIQRTIDKLEAASPVKSLLSGLDLSKSWEERSILERRNLLKLVIEKIQIFPASVRGRNTFDPARIEIVWRKEF